MSVVRIRLVALAAILGAALGLTPQSAFAQGKPWKHALLNAKADAGFFMMAAKKGFAAKQGLNLELLQVKDDQIGLKALIAGEVDSFEGGPQGAFAAVARGADVKIIGCHWVVLPHGIYVRDDIHKVEDLKGKSIAVSSPNTKRQGWVLCVEGARIAYWRQNRSLSRAAARSGNPCSSTDHTRSKSFWTWLTKTSLCRPPWPTLAAGSNA